MEEFKCVKGKSCLHCGSTYCIFVDELDQLKAENEEYKKNGIDLFEQLSNGLKANEKLKAQNEQAEQKLERIREIVNIKQEQSVFVLPSVWEQIIQIIDEVE